MSRDQIEELRRARFAADPESDDPHRFFVGIGIDVWDVVDDLLARIDAERVQVAA